MAARPEASSAGAGPDPSPDLPDRGDGTSLAMDGRVPGRRGRATRQRLLECTAHMLAARAYRDVTVIDIAREAGTSPATFYQYFADVEAAVLVLAEEVVEAGAHLAAIASDGAWDAASAVQTAGSLVDACLELWGAHRPVLRVVDLTAGEGDERFRQVQTEFLGGLTGALATVAQGAVATGRLPAGTDPTAAASVLVAMLAHSAAHQDDPERADVGVEDLRAALTRHLVWGVTGHEPV